MDFTVNDDLSTYDAQGLADTILAARAALDALLAVEDPSDADVTEAERIAGIVASLETEAAARVSAAAERTSRMAALRTAHTQPEVVEPEPVVAAVEPAVEPEPVVAAVEPAVEPARPTSRQVIVAATRTTKPIMPVAGATSRAIITAAADSGFAAGSELTDLMQTGEALMHRMRGFPVPDGTGVEQRFGVAAIRKQFPADLLQASGSGGEDDELVTHAANEHRLPNGSLVAAGGWCAPSETIYDLCAGETTDGIVSLPEVGITRGGMKFTRGIDFSVIYAAVGFSQTEAQAISGTVKTCYEVPCPTFIDVRLDAKGLCIKIPLLTEVGYPEVVRRVLAGALIAHQHKVNVSLITGMVTDAGAAVVTADSGSITSSTLNAVELLGDNVRQLYRLQQSATLEMVAPFWLKSAIRADLALRTGVDFLAVTDAMIEAALRVRKVNPQWVYGWQESVEGEEGYPATAQVLLYPAGTFVKGTAPVINLSAVYDAASLSTNIYTGLFFEEGVLLARTCYKSKLVTVPVCAAGRTGIANVANCFNLV